MADVGDHHVHVRAGETANELGQREREDQPPRREHRTAYTRGRGRDRTLSHSTPHPATRVPGTRRSNRIWASTPIIASSNPSTISERERDGLHSVTIPSARALPTIRRAAGVRASMSSPPIALERETGRLAADDHPRQLALLVSGAPRSTGHLHAAQIEGLASVPSRSSSRALFSRTRVRPVRVACGVCGAGACRCFVTPLGGPSGFERQAGSDCLEDLVCDRGRPSHQFAEVSLGDHQQL